MGIKLNESNCITIAIIIKRFWIKRRTYLTIGCRPKMFFGKVNPVYFVHHISCLLYLKLHSLRFVVHATFKWTSSLVTGSNFHHFCCWLRSLAPHKRASGVGGVICAPQPITAAHRWRNGKTLCWDDRHL